MAIQGGDDAWSYRPFEPDTGGVIGHFREHLEALNIEGAQPDMHYYLGNRYQPNQLLRLVNMGFEVVQGSDPEKWGTARLPEGVQQATDSIRAFQDVVLLRIPIARYAQIQALKAERLASTLKGAESAEEYLDYGEQRRRALGDGAPDNAAVYFRRPQHRIEPVDD